MDSTKRICLGYKSLSKACKNFVDKPNWFCNSCKEIKEKRSLGLIDKNDHNMTGFFLNKIFNQREKEN